MKKNTKFLIIYVAILFSFALVLIVFAGLTQNNYAKELAESQGIKDNLVELTKTNQTLTDSIEYLNQELDESKNETQKLLVINEELTVYKNLNEELAEALKLYESGRKKEALEKKATISAEDLTQAQLYIYNKIR